MKLDIIIPTYNRSELLQQTLQSILKANKPDELEFAVTVVDNNSKDNTRSLVQEKQKEFSGITLHYVFEEKQGLSHARNAGILSTKGDLLGFIDDDEEIHEDWILTVERAFKDEKVDFIGGTCEPNLEAEIPEWMPDNYLGAIGVVNALKEKTPLDEDYDGVLMGGNAIIRRRTIDKTGLYDTNLGRKEQKRLLSGEDREMFNRLKLIKAKGFYLPELVIYHYIPKERVTQEYLRRWVFWHGVSMGILDKKQPQKVAYLFGVPRWFFGESFRGAITILKSLFGKKIPPKTKFGAELEIRNLFGFVYGKFFFGG